MSRQKSATLEHQDLLLITLRDKFQYFIIGVIVLLFALIGVFSFAQRGLVTTTTKAMNDNQTVKLEKLGTNNLVKAMQQPAAVTGGGTYTVQQGDDLWNIAEKKLGSGILAYQIAQANNIANPNVISAGQTLTLPKLQAEVTAPDQSTGQITDEAASTQRVTNSNTSYTVHDGDSLWLIAQAQYGDGNAWVKLAQVNNITNPNLIFSGNVLVIPRS